MTKEARSKGACWTCRLRRKKCDERFPACAACTSHCLPCYGYEKPDWADGGPRQKAKTEELRVTIREVSATRRMLLKQKMSKHFVDSAISLSAVNATDVNSIIPDTALLTIDKSQSRKPLPHYVEIREMFDEYPSGQFSTPKTLSHDPRDELTDHYLDVVFPIQFPIASDSKNAREWLLPLILQVKPLYHAAISIAAYHKEISGQSVGDRNYWSIHHGLALKELRQYLGQCHGYNLAVSLESNVEVLGTIVLLVSLEVMMGDTESWFVHMKGPLHLLPSLKNACTNRTLLSPEHFRGLQFFSAVITWYNALSCASTELIPWTPKSCLRTAISGWVDVHAVIGCRGEVTISIVEIAALTVQFKQRGSEDPELAATARRIMCDLREWTQRLGTSSEKEIGVDALITRVFATAAQIYLNVVAYGSGSEPGLPKICISVTESLVALEAITDLQVLSTLMWPLCITGCMANGWQRDEMKKIFLSMKNVPVLQIGSMDRCRQIIEECWRLRRDDCDADSRTTWIEAMDSLGLKILLV
ncbi:fungal-specific transcription factor domain-containing protein [Cadophora sp. MPI-SDFR-AT-0126]|nr:fungal-specific transcription factor domain-containing protein [Leotiomycetes sp. MPI-SDFR-AT-0126]